MLAEWKPIGEAPSLPTPEEVTEQVDVKGQERQPCDTTLVLRQARGTDHDKRGTRDSMCQYMMPLSVGIDTSHKRKSVKIGCDSGVGNQEPVPSLREMLPYQPRDNEMTGKMQGMLPKGFRSSVAGVATSDR
jgi:hypothetical protein